MKERATDLPGIKGKNGAGLTGLYTSVLNGSCLDRKRYHANLSGIHKRWSNG
ncbi:MAG: hypothetical protein HXS46_01080 [Theionarchaea archaeon]|nr:hypothetical protein [Theionarchaea archaeon]